MSWGGWRRFDHVWIAVRLSVWLCVLPFRLRRYALPALLQYLTSVPRQRHWDRPQELERIVPVVVWMSHWRLFRLPAFPRACLRQSLVLYYILTRLGYPVTIHFGVQKAGVTFRGHSWITVQGTLMAEPMPPESFREVYTYASAVAWTLQEPSIMLAKK